MVDLNHYKALSDLHEWQDNYNHGDVEGIARSIRRFGFNGALRVWGSGVVMAGNHALKALKLIREQGAQPDLDQQFPPRGILVEEGDWFVLFVDVSHLDPLEAKAFAIADNKWARNAVTDDTLLTQYLQELAEQDQRLIQMVGFDDVAFQDMVRRFSTEGLPSEFPEYDESAVSRVKMVTCPHCGQTFPA